MTAIPVYTMQNLWLPQSICDNIDAKVRAFIWGDRTSHWVNWDTITLPKSKGGLSIHRARQSNIALLGKHVWSMLQEPQKLWVQLLSSKYLKDNHILNVVHSHGTSYTWFSITKAVSWLSAGFKMRLGKGEVSFWYEKWLGENLYAIWFHLLIFKIPSFLLKTSVLMVNGFGSAVQLSYHRDQAKNYEYLH